MVLPIVLATLPTLEPLKNAVRDAVATSMQEALDDVAARFPEPDCQLVPPVDVILSTVTRWSLIQEWPTLAIGAWGIAPHQTSLSEQLGGARFRGTLELQYFAQDPDLGRLATALDRYAAALFSVLVVADEQRQLAGGLLDYTSWSIAASEPAGGGPFQRAVSLLVGVHL